MCGITGILNLRKAQPIYEEQLRVMLEMIRHRGPDQFGIYLDDHIGMGSARLSIIDLGGGQQPITNEDQTLWIVYNGEVYNYIELKSYLEARGHIFSTNTDTEVILHLYEEYGPYCLAQLNGQFSIAIWDSKKRRLFLARDRLGIRPLFYTLVGGVLIFGSEIKAILADQRINGRINPFTLEQVFRYWSPLSPSTIIEGIYQVPPGHYLIAADENIKINRYWEINFPIDSWESKKSTKDESIEEFRSLLIDSTQIRLRSDVPVGAYLSGGIDSSTIAAIIRNFTGNKLDTFSISFSDPNFDESVYQIKMSRYLGVEHQVVHANYEEIGTVFPDVIWHTEMPIMRTSPAPLFLLSKLVNQNGYKVVLTGEGADEFLAGYNIFKEAAIRRFWAKQPQSDMRPLLLKRLYPFIADLSRSNATYLAAFFRQGLTETHTPDYSHSIRWHNNSRTCRFFSKDMKQIIASQITDNNFIIYPPHFAKWDALHQAQYIEITTFLSQYLLSSQGDRMAMAHSVEGRFPFLDYRLTEFCNRLPPNTKLLGLNEKYILKQVAKEWLPHDIWRRTKRPYRAPIYRSFFNSRSIDYVKDLLSPKVIKQAGLFDSGAVRQLVMKAENGGRLGETDEMALVGILSSQIVFSKFVNNFEISPPLSQADDVKVCRKSPHVEGR